MRPFLGIYCTLCRVYFRIYRSAAGSCYQGRCPRCGRLFHAPIDPSRGTKGRFFLGR